MRFLHTADWHIGLRAKALGRAGEAIREQRFRTGKAVLEQAKEAGVDFILHAGDLFDDNAVDRQLVQRTADLPRTAPCPLYIIPGNHDPFVPGSLWTHPALSALLNVHIVTEAHPVEVPKGVLYPCPLTSRASAADPTSWIRAEGDAVAIGLAHGSVEGCPIEEWDNPIPRGAAERSGLDYLALGHWHSCARFDDGGGACRMAYAGAHEATKFGEERAGKVLIVTIPHRGAAPLVEEKSVGHFLWRAVTAEVHDRADLEGIKARIDGVEAPDRTLMALSLSGVLPADGRALLDEIGALESRFFWWSLDDGTAPSPSDDRWVDLLQSGLLRETVRRLQSCDAPEAVKTRALTELY
ncbi:MAG TPA: hypothetical protein DIC53_02915, partial [Synergistaceae bacterium]|nr:hypothetical protein [Synergistaceae bacterium]